MNAKIVKTYDGTLSDVIDYNINEFRIERDSNEIQIRLIHGFKLDQSLLNSIQARFNQIQKYLHHFDLNAVEFMQNQNHTNDATNQATLYIIDHFNESWSKSPYSESYYDVTDVDFGFKPENSIRVSNHWNFYTGTQIHCATDDVNFTDGWAIGKYENGIYHILKKF